MRMVVDTMSLEEVGLHILNLYRDNYMRILNILGHREPQYRKAVYANDRLQYFKTIEVCAGNVTFNVYPCALSKADYKKSGLTFSVVAKVFYKGNSIWCFLPNFFDNGIFYTHHFFERYDERQLGGEFGTVDDKLVKRFFTDNSFKCVIDDNFRGNDNDETAMTVRYGVCLGVSMGERFHLMKTYISNDTVFRGCKKDSIDRTNEDLTELLGRKGKSIEEDSAMLIRSLMMAS